MNKHRNSRRQYKEALKSFLQDFYWSFYKERIEEYPLPMAPQSFLFVCRGNICRSPFAEHIAARIAREKQVVHFQFGSAGIEVGRAVPSPDMAKEVAENYGVNLNGHLSRSIKEINLKSYDMIIAMEGKQVKRLVGQFPELKNRIFLLPFFQPSESSPRSGYLRYNIPDPFGKEREEFIRCFDRIKLCVERLLVKVMQG
ncbi:MAG: hypothetical protein NC826_06380 [Candidatus Omnitrophica bacterium]|nr:hypothetical protein [Candidatus Omnitrophota bacterium]